MHVRVHMNVARDLHLGDTKYVKEGPSALVLMQGLFSKNWQNKKKRRSWRRSWKGCLASYLPACCCHQELLSERSLSWPCEPDAAAMSVPDQEVLLCYYCSSCEPTTQPVE